MDKILKLFVFNLIIAIILNNVSLQAQITDDKSIVGSDIYYWFFVKIKKPSNRILIKHIGREIKSGTLTDFIADHQQGLKSGKIFLGPFYQEYQVKQSQLLYKYVGKKGKVPGIDPELEGKKTEYSFFYIKPFSENFQKDIYLEPIPSRVGSGTQSDFREMLDIGLDFDKLAVGPFLRHELAEKSKFAFGNNVGKSPKNKIDSLRSKRLKRMSKKWGSLKLVIVRQPNFEDSTKYAFRFSTKFPRKYFAPHAIQIISINANYNNFNNSIQSFTLQGDAVIDNNYAVSYNMSRVYIKRFYFDKYRGAKIKGFLFESFIYNGFEMIELEPIYVPVK
ncbi:MAG: hypothetical protein B6I20_09410 [Bacteroidetes bacterium 4572_117]|nr:MAG: hypothetical protein B6I20_09410 [Bacteroidetes bacterium 4572_117]